MNKMIEILIGILIGLVFGGAAAYQAAVMHSPTDTVLILVVGWGTAIYASDAVKGLVSGDYHIL